MLNHVLFCLKNKDIFLSIFKECVRLNENAIQAGIMFDGFFSIFYNALYSFDPSEWRSEGMELIFSFYKVRLQINATMIISLRSSYIEICDEAQSVNSIHIHETPHYHVDSLVFKSNEVILAFLKQVDILRSSQQLKAVYIQHLIASLFRHKILFSAFL